VAAAAVAAAGSERSAGDDQGAGAGAGAPAAAAGDEERPAGGGGEAAATVPETALDPVCGMTVRVTGTTPSADHAGLRYWFCCGGCAAKFAADPESFLAAQAG
jgi:YHS domain-containing protein